MPVMGRFISFGLRRWPGILVFAGLITRTGSTFTSMFRQAGETALSLRLVFFLQQRLQLRRTKLVLLDSCVAIIAILLSGLH